MKRLANWLETQTARAALGFARSLGPEAASDLGGAIARRVGPLLPVSRVADANLRLALPELDAPARQAIVRGAWENLGRTMTELPHLPNLRRTASGPGWEIVNEHILTDLAARGGPAIFISGHIGNWEMMPAIVAHFGMKMSSVYRAAANEQVDALLGAIRADAMGGAVPMFPKGAVGARAAMRHLSAGGFLGMLVDQKMNDGVPAPFFGRDAMTAPAPAALALRFRCPVIPGHVRRVGPARLRLTVEPPIPLPETGERRQDVAQMTAELNRVLERWIRDWPEGWLWLHRRWPKDVYKRG